MTSEVFAPAKINLTLHVTGQRGDGYHLLDSLVVFADVGDHLELTPARETSLFVTGPFAQGVPTDGRNSVLRAAELVGASHAITLTKNLPHGAGIGGGSADAAAILRFFGRTEGAEGLGADVPVCVASVAQRMRGIGEQLMPLSGVPTLPAVLVNPGVHIPTPDVFRALSIKANPPMPDDLPLFQTPAKMISWLRQMRNDLQEPACQGAPVILDVLTALQRSSPMARMSGSGATCFGLFETLSAARRTSETIASKHPDWWVQACTLS